jgi:hypothetical protein
MSDIVKRSYVQLPHDAPKLRDASIFADYTLIEGAAAERELRDQLNNPPAGNITSSTSQPVIPDAAVPAVSVSAAAQ